MQPAGIRAAAVRIEDYAERLRGHHVLTETSDSCRGPGGSSDVGVALAASGNNKGKKPSLLATSNL